VPTNENDWIIKVIYLLAQICLNYPAMLLKSLWTLRWK